MALAKRCTSAKTEFEPSPQAIRNWVRQADRDAGHRQDGLTTLEQEELRRLRREVRQLREERAILSKVAAWFARETNSIPSKEAEFVTAHQAVHRVATMCRVLGVSPSGYYAWRKRRLSPRARPDVELAARIDEIHRMSRGTYGVPPRPRRARGPGASGSAASGSPG